MTLVVMDPDVRVHQNPVAQEPRIPANQRPGVPIPPAFREDEVFMVGIQVGLALQAQQEENVQLRAQLAARDRPPEEPDPELPGAGEPPSEQPTDEASTELIEDDSEETLDFNEAEERSDDPGNTDNDPYEQQEDAESETEEPDDSQAEVRAVPDVTHIDIDESSEEAKESETPEQPSQGEETPRTAIEATAESPTESVETKERLSQPSKPHEFTGSIADWAKLMKSSSAESKYGKTPQKESAAKSSEHSAPQASPSETTSTREDKEQSSKPTQGEGESSSASQAPPAEPSAASASEIPKPGSSEQTSSEANPLGGFELGKLHRRRNFQESLSKNLDQRQMRRRQNVKDWKRLQMRLLNNMQMNSSHKNRKRSKS